MRALILCAGEAARWDNYLGVPKHLIEIDGEPLLHRTVRLLRENGVADIYIVSKADARYQVEGATQYVPVLNHNNAADKFLSSKSLWNTEGRTVVLFGDVYFTEAAMQTICTFTSTEWTWFCRFNASSITGKSWGEGFAQSFYPADIPKHEAALHRIANLYKRGRINRCRGWEHYRAIIGLPDSQLRQKIRKGNYCEIDDWTDDFDFPVDYDRFMEMRYTSANSA